MKYPFGIFALPLIALVFGCTAPKPKQVVIASTEEAFDSLGVAVSTFRIPKGLNNIGILSDVVNDELNAIQPARNATRPGIAANGDFYAVAYWGLLPGFNNLLVFTSDSARNDSWSRAGTIPASSSQIDNLSGPALSHFPQTATWFAAFRDASTGTIVVLQLSIRDSGQIDRRSNTQRVVRLINVTDTRIVTPQPPAISFVGSTLVLAFVSASNVVNVALADGSLAGTGGPAFSPIFGSPAPAVIGTPGSAILSDAGAPGLHNVLSTLYMATARSNHRTGDVDIHVAQSSNGRNWSPGVIDLTAAAHIPPTGPVDPSIAGLPAEMVVAYRSDIGSATTARINGASYSMQTKTARGVGMTYGPGPYDTYPLSCAETTLIVRTRNGDTPIEPLPISGRTIVTGGNDVTLLCGQNTTINPQCPRGTNVVTVRGRNANPSAQPYFSLQCWPK